MLSFYDNFNKETQELNENILNLKLQLKRSLESAEQMQQQILIDNRNFDNLLQAHNLMKQYLLNIF